MPKLATPRLTADGYSKLTWNRVENATKYVVQSIIETVEVEKDKTSYDALKMLKSFIDKEGNSFNAFVRIKAVGDGINYEDSLYGYMSVYQVRLKLIYMMKKRKREERKN